MTSQPVQENMMQTFTTPAPVTAVVDIPAGRIQVSAAADRASSTVQIQPADPGKGRDVKLAGQVTVTYSDGDLRVQGPAGHRILGSTGAVQVTVELPAGSRVQARAASAGFTTMGPLSEVSFDSAQGTVSIGQAGTARLSTVDGDITVARLDGDAEIRTVKGDIQVSEAAQGTLVLSTQTGEITVGAAAGTSAALDAGTTVGRIRNSLTSTGGTPALAIHATTTVGDITARSL
jgi:putative adhesin